VAATGSVSDDSMYDVDGETITEWLTDNNLHDAGGEGGTERDSGAGLAALALGGLGGGEGAGGRGSTLASSGTDAGAGAGGGCSNNSSSYGVSTGNGNSPLRSKMASSSAAPVSSLGNNDNEDNHMVDVNLSSAADSVGINGGSTAVNNNTTVRKRSAIV
jgi:hypothetical protein